jgi:hypothetical protein
LENRLSGTEFLTRTLTFVSFCADVLVGEGADGANGENEAEAGAGQKEEEEEEEEEEPWSENEIEIPWDEDERFNSVGIPQVNPKPKL